MTRQLQSLALRRQHAVGRRVDHLVGYVGGRVRAWWCRLRREIDDRPADLHARVMDCLDGMRRGAGDALFRGLYELTHWTAAATRRNLRAGLSRRRLDALARHRLIGARPLKEDAWDDLFGEPPGPAELSDAALFALLFPPPPAEFVNRVVYASGWQDRLLAGTRLGSPETLAQIIATGAMMGQSLDEITRLILPAVENIHTSARRIARTEGLRVAASVQMQAHEQLGDLVIGYRIHATLDDRTRPEHRERDGTVYYRDPGPGQKGMGEMPRPPMEADGTPAFNCRCFLTPVLR